MKRHFHLRTQSVLKFFLSSRDQAVALSLDHEGELTVFIRTPTPAMGVMRYPALPALLDKAAEDQPWTVVAIPCPTEAQTRISNPVMVGLALASDHPLAAFIPAKLAAATVAAIFAALPSIQMLGGREGLHLRDTAKNHKVSDTLSAFVAGSGTRGGAS